MTIESHKAEIVARIEELKQEISDFDISEHFDESEFEDELNENSVEVCGYSYGAGTVLKEVDYTVFLEAFNNWVDGKDNEEVEEYNGIIEELEELESELSDIEEQEADEE